MFDQKQFHQDNPQKSKDKDMKSKHEEIIRWEDEGGAIVPPTQLPKDQEICRPIISRRNRRNNTSRLVPQY